MDNGEVHEIVTIEIDVITKSTSTLGEARPPILTPTEISHISISNGSSRDSPGTRANFIVLLSVHSNFVSFHLSSQTF